MRGSSKYELGKQGKKKIDHYFQNKKIYLGGGGAKMVEKHVLAQSTRFILPTLLYYIVLWMSIAGQEHRPFLLFFYVWKTPKVGCSSKSGRTQHPSSYSPYARTNLTGLENLLCYMPRQRCMKYQWMFVLGLHREQHTRLLLHKSGFAGSNRQIMFLLLLLELRETQSCFLGLETWVPWFAQSLHL